MVAQRNIQPENAVNTGILYDLVVPLSGIEKYDGTATSTAITLKNWRQIYFELNKAALQPEHFIPVTQIKHLAEPYLGEGIIPIGLQLYHYNYLNESLGNFADERGNLDFTGKEIPVKTVFSSAPLKSKTYNGRKVKFTLSDDLIFSNFKVLPQSFFIQFDGKNSWVPIFPGQMLSYSYTSTGRKTIRLKAVFEDGKELFSGFCFDVIVLAAPEPTATWSVEGDIPYLGDVATGEAFIYLSDENTKLTRPIVISEGIDPENELGWEELYDFLNQENLIEDLRAEGFDVVVVNYQNTNTYIQRNAFLMVKLLQMINDTIDYQNQVVTVGPSMGGLVVRYALTYMEANAMDHNSNLFILFDTPNQGANIPLGLQYMMFFGKDLDQGIQDMVDILDSPSPKQMLAYHYTDPPSATAGADPMFNDFFTELEGIGDYPENLRKIAVSDGSGYAVGQPFQPGDQVIDYNYSSFSITLKSNVWAVEDHNTAQIFEGKAFILFVMDDELNVTVYSEKPYDNCPGGYSSTFAQMDSIEMPYGDIIALHDNHSYIPTMSALDIDDDDLFYNIAANPAIMNKTPFDSIYWSDQNYEHVLITPYLKEVIFDEVVQTKPPEHTISLQQGWNDLSSNLDPQNKDVISITGELGDNLIILQNLTQVYWPYGGLNTIGDWDYKSGYFIKLQQAADLKIVGNEPENKTVTFVAGWNIFPVLSKNDVSITTLFQNNLDDIIIIKDAVGSEIFWPAAGVSTLNTLKVGRGYLIKVEAGFCVTF
jgi:hypothetical protein